MVGRRVKVDGNKLRKSTRLVNPLFFGVCVRTKIDTPKFFLVIAVRLRATHLEGSLARNPFSITVRGVSFWGAK